MSNIKGQFRMIDEKSLDEWMELINKNAHDVHSVILSMINNETGNIEDLRNSIEKLKEIEDMSINIKNNEPLYCNVALSLKNFD